MSSDDVEDLTFTDTQKLPLSKAQISELSACRR